MFYNHSIFKTNIKSIGGVITPFQILFSRYSFERFLRCILQSNSTSTASTKINTEKKEKDYIKHFKEVFESLKDPKFEKIVLEYEKIMHKFFIDHTFIFPSKSLEKNIKNILGEYNKALTIYKLNCSLWKKNNEIKKLNTTLSKKENIIQTIMFSNSWELTKPFRNFGTMLRNLK